MPASTNSTSAPESSAASTGSGANSQQSQQLPSANDSSQASQQHQPSSALSATSSSSSLASRILAPFLRFTSSSSVAVPPGLPSPLAAAGTSSSEKGTSATSSVTGSEQAQQDALHNEQGDNGEKMQQQTSLFGSSSLTSGETVIAQPAVAFDNDQPVVQQTAPLGVTEYLLLETLARTISAKATWSQAVSAAQATAASLNLTDPVPAKLVILEQDCEDPWTQRDAIRQVEVVIRPDIFMSVASAAKMVDHAATVFMRMLNKYRLAKVMAEAMDMTSIDPMPWQLMSLHVLREHLLGHFTHQPARIPFNGFGHAIAAAAAPTGAADSVAGSITADIDGGGAESDAVNSSVHKRCASSASDASSTGSCASPNVRRLGSGLVGSSMPTPALLTSRESHLDRRPTSLVNYNNSSTARNKYVSPPSSTVALNHPEAHLLVRNSTPVPYVHARPQSPVSEHQARVAHPKPHKLTLSIPNARHAPRPAPAEFSPLIFDKNRYIRPGGAPIALHSDSPLATPLPSPGPTSPGNMGIALPAAAANAGLMLSEGVMRAMAANGGRLSRPSTPAARAMSGLDGSSGSGGTTQEGSSSLSKSQAV